MVGLSQIVWTSGSLVSRQTNILAEHFIELKNGIQDLWNGAGMGTVPNWAAGSAPSRSRRILASDINDLRNWVNQYEGHQSYAQLAFQWFGCDTNSNVFPCGADFYIGQMSNGNTPTFDTNDFNKSAAGTVGRSATYGYSFLNGPASATPPATTVADAKKWGADQAQAAAVAWEGTSEVGRDTVFGDIEGAGANGWVGNQQLDQAVWEGFWGFMSGGITVGLYVGHQSDWNSIMGAGYLLQAGVWVWSADSNLSNCSTDSTHHPLPQNCPTSFPSLPSIGGITPSVWQFNVQGPSGCPDDVDMIGILPP